MSSPEERVRAAMRKAMPTRFVQSQAAVDLEPVIAAGLCALLAELRAPEPGAEERLPEPATELRDIEASKAVNRTRLTKPTLEGLFREGWDAALRAARGGR